MDLLYQCIVFVCITLAISLCFQCIDVIIQKSSETVSMVRLIASQ